MYDRGVGVATVVFGAALLVGTLRLPEAMLGDPAGPRLLPLMLSWALVGLGAFLALGPGPGQPTSRLWGGGVRLTLAAALLFLYAFLLTPAGYVVATTAVLMALLALYNPGRLVLNGVVAVAFTGVTYLLFHTLLGVYMPRGILG